MNVLLIVGHPNNNSFNHAIADTCRTQILKNGHFVFFHDLYKEQFNPVHQSESLEFENNETIKKHSFDLMNSDGIIIIHPNWWGQPPAIVKGWLDLVLLPEIAYKFDIDENGKPVTIGLLKAKVAMVFNTSNTSEELESTLYKDPLETIWKNRVFGFCGVKQFERRNFRVVKDSSLDERMNWLSEIELLIDTYFPKIVI